MLECCGMTSLCGVVALDLDRLIGLDCMGVVVGSEIIEFYRQNEWDVDFLNMNLSRIPQYVM